MKKKGLIGLLNGALAIPIMIASLHGCDKSTTEHIDNVPAVIEPEKLTVPPETIEPLNISQEEKEAIHKAINFVSQDITHYNQIEDLVQKVYQETTGNPLLLEYHIMIVPKDKFEDLYQRYSGSRDKHIGGFALPDTRTLYVPEGKLCHVLLTVFHEIKHIDERVLNNPVAEEAQSYAFELYAIDNMRKMGYKIESNFLMFELLRSKPKEEKHLKAFNSVMRQYHEGKSPKDIYIDITIGKTIF